MSGRLDGKVALITGAAGGIGSATASRFVAEGARCVLADVREDALIDLANGLGGAALAVECDVTDEDDVAAAVDRAVEGFGQLDCMFNNAGAIGVTGPIAETPLEDWNRTLEVLLTGVFLGIKHAARVMIPAGSGSIISTASTAAVLGGLGPHAYTAAKHGVVGLTKAVASELVRYGIRTNCIAPGSVVSAMTAKAIAGDPADLAGAEEAIGRASLLGRAGLPEDVANAAVYLASHDAGYVNGHCLTVDAGETVVGSRYRYMTDRVP